MLFRKRFGKSGDYHTPQGQITLSDALKQKMVANFQAAKAGGLRVPVTWGHQPDTAHDVRDHLYWTHRNSLAGWVHELSLTPDGEMEALVEIPLDDDAKRIGTVVQEVSPVIHERFKDGLGREYEGFMGQLALVQYPVEPGQENFERVEPQKPPHRSPLGVGYVAMSLSVPGTLEKVEMSMFGDPRRKDLGNPMQPSPSSYKPTASTYPPPPPPAAAPAMVPPTSPGQGPRGRTREMGYDDYGMDTLAAPMEPPMSATPAVQSEPDLSVVMSELRDVAEMLGIHIPQTARLSQEILLALVASIGTKGKVMQQGQQMDPMQQQMDPNQLTEVPPPMGGLGLGGVSMSLDPKDMQAIKATMEHDQKVARVDRILALRDRGVIGPQKCEELCREVVQVWTMSLAPNGKVAELPVDRSIRELEAVADALEASRRKAAETRKRNQDELLEEYSPGPGGSYSFSLDDDPKAQARREALVDELIG